MQIKVFIESLCQPNLERNVFVKRLTIYSIKTARSETTSPTRLFLISKNEIPLSVSLRFGLRMLLRYRRERLFFFLHKKWFHLETLSWMFLFSLSESQLRKKSILFNSFYGTARAIDQLKTFLRQSENYGMGGIREKKNRNVNFDHRARVLCCGDQQKSPPRQDFMWFHLKICRLMCW